MVFGASLASCRPIPRNTPPADAAWHAHGICHLIEAPCAPSRLRHLKQATMACGRCCPAHTSHGGTMASIRGWGDHGTYRMGGPWPQTGDHGLWQVLPGTHKMALHEMLPVLDRPSVLGSGVSVRTAVPTPRA
eukprot:COSAG01_NODE_2003_length_8671_cov_9.134858_5_plen_133_part_00